ncbi:hypothetical protein O5D80_003704 [Batrachochytrium dendrobatidis]|nr:hypothetical protein O5D80_003704 [Batrachochytrium dendrobatidis]
MAPSTSLQFLELPGSNGYIHGLYGLEACTVRGLIRIQHPIQKPLYIKRLKLTLKGLLWTRFLDTVVSFDMVRREKVLFEICVDVLQDAEIDKNEINILSGILDVPFEIAWPLHDPVTNGHGPSHQLLPPSCTVFGQSGSLHHYQSNVEYTLTATLVESAVPLSSIKSGNSLNSSTADLDTADGSSGHRSGFSASLGAAAATFGLGSLFAPPVRTCILPISPFVVYDARMLPIIMHPDPRRWRSSPGMVPIEYDIEVGPIALGPNDPIRFAYRMIVDSESARLGVRVKKVTFILKETHIVGEDRCCIMDDQQQYYHIHQPPARVKGVTELLRWEHTEYNPISQSDSVATGKPESGYLRDSTTAGSASGLRASSSSGPRLSSYQNSSLSRQVSFQQNTAAFELLPLRESQKSVEVMSRPGTRGGAGDGLYVENETTLYIPSLGGFTATTAKPVIPSENYICQKLNPREAILQVRHSVHVTIDFIEAERISIESGVYLLSVGHEECAYVLDNHPEILPTLDYDKIVGIETWVPEYSAQDQVFMDSCSSLLHSQQHDSDSYSSHSFHPVVPERSHSIDTTHSLLPHRQSDAQSIISDDMYSTDTDLYGDSNPSRNMIPDSPTPRYEDIMRAPISTQSSVTTTKLDNNDTSHNYLDNNSNNISVSHDRLYQPYSTESLPSIPLNSAACISHSPDSTTSNSDRSPMTVLKSTSLANSNEDQNAIRDPLTWFASEPPSIMPLEEALSEAMQDLLDTRVQLSTGRSRVGRYSVHLHGNTSNYRDRDTRSDSLLSYGSNCYYGGSNQLSHGDSHIGETNEDTSQYLS